MNDHDLDAALVAKYRARSNGSPTPSLARRVLAIPATTPKRRGRLPRIPFGGIKPMFSPNQLVAAAAVIAIGGGALLAGSVSGPASGPGTAATSPLSAPAVVAVDPAEHPPGEFSGSLRYWGDEGEFEPLEVMPGIFEWTTPAASVTWQTDDPRLAGSGIVSEHGVQHPSSAIGLRAWRWTIENDDGAWIGRSESFAYPEHDDPGAGLIVFDGTGAYAGLSAYLRLGDASDGLQTFVGVVFPSSFPEPPSVTAGD